MAMGRKRKANKDLPQRVYLSRGWYFYVTKDGKWHKLAKAGDKSGMHKALAERFSDSKSGTYGVLFDEFSRKFLDDKPEAKRTKDDYKPETIKGYRRQIKTLKDWCGDMPLGTLTSGMVVRYLEERTAKVLANREFALLSVVCAQGVKWEYLTANPCQGVERNTEAPRRHKIEDQAMARAWVEAKPWLRALMRMAVVTGQRRGDLLYLKQSQFGPKGLRLIQNKTGKDILLTWTPALKFAYDFAKAQRPVSHISGLMFCTDKGQRISAIRYRREWERVQQIVTKESEGFQFRDLRAYSATAHETGDHLANTPAVRDRHYRLDPKQIKPL